MSLVNFFLTFSDSAKFADAAKSLYLGNGYLVHHSFFNSTLLSSYQPGQGFVPSFLPFNSYFLSLVFRFFPINDTTVALTGLSFLLASAVLLFFISKSISSHTLPAIFAAALLLVNRYYAEYALNFTTEITFIFFLILSAFFLTRSKLIFKLLALLPLFVLLTVRPQAPLVLVALLATAILFYLSRPTPLFPKLVQISLLGLLVLLVIGLRYNFNYTTIFGSYAGSLSLPTDAAQGLFLRGVARQRLSSVQIFSKIFYNLYNYLKDPARLLPPLLLPFYLFALIKSPQKNYPGKFVSYFSLSLFTLFVLAAAATLPNARYVHPVIALVFVPASLCLYHFTQQKRFTFHHLSFPLLAFFIFLPHLGYFTLDYRFRLQNYNPQKPPAYQLISQQMATVIPKDQLTITNLDAWAAWYQGLTTMWFPISPDSLQSDIDSVNYLALTDYNTNDADFALGEWQAIFDHPSAPPNQLIAQNFVLLDSFTISADTNYHNQDYHLHIFKRRE